MTNESENWLVKPESTRPPLIPELGPRQVGGFRFARIFDGLTPDHAPAIAEERGYVTDPETRERLLAYLAGGAVVVKSQRYGQDMLEPTRHYAVNVSTRTDGLWIWSGAVEFYLRWHQVAPEPEFLRHIVANDYSVPPVPDDVVQAARAAVKERWRVVSQLEHDWLAKRGGLRTGDPTRFSPKLNEMLLDLGWYKGRDVSKKVDAWLDRMAWAWTPDPDDPPAYALTPAVRRVLNEFGGIVSYLSGPGQTMGRTPFEIYPVTGDEDLSWWMGRVLHLGEVIEKQVFQIGEVERGVGALVVDEDGEVYLAGPDFLYAGENIDMALAALLEGHAMGAA